MEISASQANAKLWQALDGIKTVREYAAGSTLYQAGHPACGAYLVQSGAVNIWLGAGSGGDKLLRRVGAGMTLGLSESVTGDRYQATAKAAQPTRVDYVERTALLEYLRSHHELCVPVVQLLSEDLQLLYDHARSMESVSRRGRKRSRGES